MGRLAIGDSNVRWKVTYGADDGEGCQLQDVFHRSFGRVSGFWRDESRARHGGRGIGRRRWWRGAQLLVEHAEM